MDKKAYRDRLRSQDKRERTAASLGLPYSGRDLAIAFGLYLAAVLLCLFLRNIDLHRDTSYVAVIFLLDVFLTAYWTNGYILGIITAVAGVFSVDYIFTYPYWHISFTLTGFPLTFLVMLIVSVVVSTLTTQIKQQEKIRAEAEKEKEKQQHRRSRHHRSSRSQPLQGQTDPHSLAALAEEVMEQEEGAAPSRRRSSRSRGRSKPSGARQEKPNREAPSAKPGEGGEKKSRSRWHRRGHRRSGGQGSGSQTPPPQN